MEMDRHASHTAPLVRLPRLQEVVVDSSAASSDHRASGVQRGRRCKRFTIDKSGIHQGLTSGFDRQPRKARRVAERLSFEEPIGNAFVVDVAADSAVDDCRIEILRGTDTGLTGQQPLPQLAGAGSERSDRAQACDDDPALRSRSIPFVVCHRLGLGISVYASSVSCREWSIAPYELESMIEIDD